MSRDEFETSISFVEPGRVLIRGYSLAELIGHVPYVSASFLTLFGRLPNDSEKRLVDAMLTSLLDHGWVASTITTARYAASGNPQLVPAVAAGILAAGSNTLSPEHCFKLLDDVAAAMIGGKSRKEAAREAVKTIVADGQRVPGLGHPTHRNGDFRTEILITLADELELSGESVEVYREVQAATLDITGHDLAINIDACLASLGRDLGWSVNQTVAIALLSVLPGLMAHAIEEIQLGVPLRYIHNGKYVGEGYRSLPESALHKTGGGS